jgi:hypothetical protein
MVLLRIPYRTRGHLYSVQGASPFIPACRGISPRQGIAGSSLLSLPGGRTHTYYIWCSLRSFLLLPVCFMEIFSKNSFFFLRPRFLSESGCKGSAFIRNRQIFLEKN